MTKQAYTSVRLDQLKEFSVKKPEEGNDKSQETNTPKKD